MEYSPHTSCYPLKLEIELTSRCNINPPCPMCSRVLRTQDDEKDLSDKLMDRLQNALEAAEVVSLHGVGEPLISKQFEPAILRVGPETKVSFNSNGQIMTDSIIENLLSKPVFSIMFSLDAATEESYHKIRAYGDVTLEDVKANIQKLRAERDRRELVNPELNLCMVLMKVNYRELPAFVRLGEELGCMGVYAWTLSRPTGPDDYLVHVRNNFLFDYEKQSDIPESELNDIISHCSKMAEEKGILFDVGR